MIKIFLGMITYLIVGVGVPILLFDGLLFIDAILSDKVYFFVEMLTVVGGSTTFVMTLFIFLPRYIVKQTTQSN